MGEAGPVGLAYHILFIDSPVSQAVQNMRDRPTVAASTFFLFYTGQSSGHHHILTLDFMANPQGGGSNKW